MKPHEFDIFYQPPAEIEEKRIGYTIKVIGGPEEYKTYMLAKKARIERELKEKREAYLMRRVVLEDILLGDKQASPEALQGPPTLEYARWDMRGRPRGTLATTHIKVETRERSLERPTLRERVRSKLSEWVSRVVGE